MTGCGGGLLNRGYEIKNEDLHPLSLPKVGCSGLPNGSLSGRFPLACSSCILLCSTMQPAWVWALGSRSDDDESPQVECLPAGFVELGGHDQKAQHIYFLRGHRGGLRSRPSLVSVFFSAAGYSPSTHFYRASVPVESVVMKCANTHCCTPDNGSLLIIESFRLPCG